MAVAEWIVNLLAAYASLGVLFALAFVGVGVGRVDPIANDSTFAFRLIVFPGVAALWPLLLTKWIKIGRARA